ncbi:MAG: hypothetical protein ACTHJ8_04115 [Mucilaginibacter sp.]
MRVEDANAFRFIFEDELYLLEQDKKYYANALIPKPEIKTPSIEFNYMGGNKKNFLVLVNYTAHELMPDEHLAALESVLTRKGLSRDEIALLNLAKNINDNQVILEYFKPKTLLVLGKTAIPAAMDEPSFNQITQQQNINVLYTFGFEEMMDNVANKRSFWEQVKNL